MINSSHVIDVSEATFDEDVLQQSYETPVVVDFWAPWCGPCRMLGPTLERLAMEGNGEWVLAKLNVDDNPSLAMQYGVQGIPAVKAFRNGQVVDDFVGAQPEPQVRAFIKRIVPGESDTLLSKGEALLQDREWEAAEALFRRVSDTMAGRLGLVRALLGQGEGCEAREVLEQIKDPAALSDVEALTPLADYLCEMEGPTVDEAKVPPIEAQYRQAARILRRGNFAGALDGLLEVLREQKGYRNGQAKAAVLGIFALLGDEDPLTQQYRPQLAMVLF